MAVPWSTRSGEHPVVLRADTYTLREHEIDTPDGLHSLYVQEWGAAHGIPMLFLHGGPGSGCAEHHKDYFDREVHRAVFVDQRGSGRSRPVGSMDQNTTFRLVEDLELVRSRLGIERWHVVGGSWGSTLALCYAIAHPQPIQSLLVRGVFLGTRTEIDWIERGAFRRFYPELWERLDLTDSEIQGRGLPLEAYAQIGTALGSLVGGEADGALTDNDRAALTIEQAFNDADFFLEDGYILAHAADLDIPVQIIQGRYDMLTPPVTAYALHRTLPLSRFHMTLAGHDGRDRENIVAVRSLLVGLAGGAR
jgi:proline iminopeptidase